MKKFIPTLFIALVLSIVFSLSSQNYSPTLNENSKSASTVFVIKNNKLLGIGTGTFINNRNKVYLLTCKHVACVGDELSLGYCTIDNDIAECSVKLAAYSKKYDFAIIEVKHGLPFNATMAKYINADNVKMGDSVYYFGLIERPEKTFLHKGLISQKNLQNESGYYNSINTIVMKGSSGATVFNENGAGIGIITVKFKDSQGGYLPITTVYKSLVNSGYADIAGILDGNCNISILEKYGKVIELP